MARRYYAMGRTATEAVADQEKAREGLLESLGATPEQLAGAKRLAHIIGTDRAPDRISMGRQGAETSIAKGEKIVLEESHTNSAGERITVAVRQNGPHVERFRIREVPVGPNSLMITEHFGGH